MNGTDRNSSSWSVGAPVALVLLVIVVYHNAVGGAFVFDDRAAILENPTIRSLGDLGAVLSPPNDAGQTVGGRPVVNLTLALNHAMGGTDPRGYHVFNLGVHALAVLVLFGVLRRTLARGRFAGEARSLAFAASAIWAVHPLATESVAYVIQRAESLVGLFYLLTLYGFIRAVDSSASRRWQVFAVVTCAIGMATKEVMVTAPLAVWLYDVIFVAGTWGAAWRQRKQFYGGLAATWLLLGWLVISAENRGGTAGLGAGDSSWHYLLTQSRALCTYFGLAVWPSPLVFDYGTTQIERLADALPYAVIVLALLAAVILALRRRHPAGFLGAVVFLVLAPSSSFVPIPVQPMAEHRMYLPLAAIATLAVLGWRLWWPRAGRIALVPVVVVLGAAALARNEVYSSPLTLWGDTVAKSPGNARAHAKFADALLTDGRVAEAIARYENAIQLEASAVDSGRTLLGEHLVNYGNALLAADRIAEAARAYERALEFSSAEKLARYNLGTIAMKAGRLPEARQHLEAAVRLDPNYPSAHTNLGSVLLQMDRPADALSHYEAALRLTPSAKAHTNVGLALFAAGRHREAAGQFEQALRLDPQFTTAADFLGQVRAELARMGAPVR